MSVSIRELAANREKIAYQLSDEEIWCSVVDKFIKLDVPLYKKAEMLFSAVGNQFYIIEMAFTYGLKRNYFDINDVKSIYDELIKLLLSYNNLENYKHLIFSIK